MPKVFAQTYQSKDKEDESRLFILQTIRTAQRVMPDELTAQMLQNGAGAMGVCWKLLECQDYKRYHGAFEVVSEALAKGDLSTDFPGDVNQFVNEVINDLGISVNQQQINEVNKELLCGLGKRNSQILDSKDSLAMNFVREHQLDLKIKDALQYCAGKSKIGILQCLQNAAAFSDFADHLLQQRIDLLDDLCYSLEKSNCLNFQLHDLIICIFGTLSKSVKN